ncbi:MULTISPECIES: DUF1330 domain-containing protein [unclassified Novosphingobium]|uniref:DUF1330 domain-containing protein n=1 Tax=unclassified Novosphingobium TaxID=2644732 RepID=UPI000ED2A6C5|nr:MULTISPECIES: DUF1330 domain-containing protein [unclassified Novosphingobium]HCF24987.1 DUF1330 domain-containing protein [Novosphingobium sp.]HQV03632.1 DUF1330 domain-containing protein [Novosphingobium sp.]
MVGYVDPSRENWQAFKDLPRDTPIHMLNLIKFRELAEYPEGHPNHGKGLTGREAYAIYKEGFQRVVADDGAAMVWEAPIECVVTGPAGEWDEAFVMGYPNSGLFMAMVKNEEYVRDVVPHRTAAVADSRLIRFRG